MSIEEYLDTCHKREEAATAEKELEQQIYATDDLPPLVGDVLLTQYVYVKRVRQRLSVLAAVRFLALSSADKERARSMFGQRPSVDADTAADLDLVRQQITRLGLNDVLAPKQSEELSEFRNAAAECKLADQPHQRHLAWLHLWDEAADAVNCAAAAEIDCTADVLATIREFGPSHEELLPAALTQMCIAKLFITQTRPTIWSDEKPSSPDAMNGGETVGP